jgi:hypothetical protein
LGIWLISFLRAANIKNGNCKMEMRALNLKTKKNGPKSVFLNLSRSNKVFNVSTYTLAIEVLLTINLELPPSA